MTEQKSRFGYVMDFLNDNFTTLIVLSLLGLAGALYFDVALPSGVPRWAHTAFWTAAIGSPLSYVLATKIVDYLYDPYGVLILDIDATDQDVALWSLSKKEFEDLDVISGSLYHLEASRPVYSGREFDPEDMTIRGTWRGSIPDLELLQEQAKIEEARGQLLEEAQRGFAVETHAWMIVRQATRAAVRNITQTFEQGTLPGEGESINDAIEAAIEDFDFAEVESARSGETTADVSEGIDVDVDPSKYEVPADD